MEKTSVQTIGNPDKQDTTNRGDDRSNTVYEKEVTRVGSRKDNPDRFSDLEQKTEDEKQQVQQVIQDTMPKTEKDGKFVAPEPVVINQQEAIPTAEQQEPIEQAAAGQPGATEVGQ